MYNKLVRDNIPDIIVKAGKKPTFDIVYDDEIYEKMLNDKLVEEVNEYLNSGEVVELCDIAEVILAILKMKKVSYSDYTKMRMEKATVNGSFKKRIFLRNVE